VILPQGINHDKDDISRNGIPLEYGTGEKRENDKAWYRKEPALAFRMGTKGIHDRSMASTWINICHLLEVIKRVSRHHEEMGRWRCFKEP
jgi:hypothetical protein